MKKLVKTTFLSMLACIGITLSSCNAQVPNASLKTDVDSISYAQGVLIGANLSRILEQQGIDDAYKADFLKGFKEAINADSKDEKAKAEALGKSMASEFNFKEIPSFNEYLFGKDSDQSISRKDFLAGFFEMAMQPENAKMTTEDAEKCFNETLEAIRKKTEEKIKSENADFLENNKTKEGVVTLPSGLQYKVITQGTGATPGAADTVKVHYHGTNIKGTVFDSSVEKGEPVEFPVNQVISGWTEGLQLMSVGSKYTLYIPYNLAYGEQSPDPNIPPFGTLIFDVELLDIKKATPDSSK